MLSTDEVARRLGVKPATVYAYVSRGLLSSRRNADGKGSLFDPAEVDAFVAGRRGGPSPVAPAIHTGITLIRDGRLFYRGRDALVLAREQSFESVATLLWTGERDDVELIAPAEMVALAEAVTAPLPSSARLADRLRVIVAAAAAADPLRFDTTPSAVIATGRTILATMVSALPIQAPANPELDSSELVDRGLGGPGQVADRKPDGPEHAKPKHGDPERAGRKLVGPELAGPVALAGSGAAGRELADPERLAGPEQAGPEFLGGSGAAGLGAAGRELAGPERLTGPGLAGSGLAGPGLAGALWSRLTEVPAHPAGLAALNAALVLLADHDIAASTLAARVAASTRAHPYAVVGAGLAALDGPLHGAASGLAYELIADAVRDGDPVRAISERLRVGGIIPGFGHPLYPDGDPRATTLLQLMREDEGEGEGKDGDGVLAVVGELAAAMARRPGMAPNIDFAVAALTLIHGMPADAGEAIFAIARTAGWIAHALEEYGDRPSRFRPSGHYAGRTPAT